MTTRLALVLTAGFAWWGSGTVAYAQPRLPSEINQLVEAGKHSEAIVLLSKRLEGSNPALHVMLAEVYCSQFPSDWPSAKSSARRALAVDPTNGPAHQILGAIAVQEGDFATGIRESSVALGLSMSPQYRVEANRRLGNAYEGQGDFLSAARAYEAALAVAPTPDLKRPDEILYLWVGQALIRAGRYAEAIGPLEQSIKFLTPKPTAARVALGLSVVALEKAGRHEEARKRQEEWERAEPDATVRKAVLKRVGESPPPAVNAARPSSDAGGTASGSPSTTGESARSTGAGQKLPPLELEGTSWYCSVPLRDRQFEGFLYFHPGGTVKMAEARLTPPCDNCDYWPSIDPNRNGDDTIAWIRNQNEPGHPDDRWASRPDEARFAMDHIGLLYVLYLRSGNLVGTIHEPDDASSSRLFGNQPRISLFEAATKSEWTGQISCSRASGWLQR